MYSITTQFTFEAAHRLRTAYTEACFKNLHGHSYKVEVEIASKVPNQDNMVCDFKKLKEILHHNIEEKYDHSCILHEDDPLAEPVRKNCDKVFLWQENPTAESMARRFYYDISTTPAFKDLSCDLVRVTVWETEHNMATYKPDWETC